LNSRANGATAVRDGGVELGDTALVVRPADDGEDGVPDALLPGWGGTMRDGLGVRAQRGGVEIAITGGLVLDPVLGVRRASLGVSGGRITAVGRAGNPDIMDGVDVVLDAGTAVIDATGLIVTPGVVDSHVHFLSPQVGPAALAGGVTTLMVQDPGPVWNLGSGPAPLLQALYAAFGELPINLLALVRGSATDPELVADGLRAGGGGLKIHEDVGAGPEQLRCAVAICDRFDVQLAIHTDGLNEALGVDGTRRALGGRPVHLFHIEGCGGGHAPDLLELAGDPAMLCSSTNPTVPYGVGAEAEHLAMVAAVHLLDPGATPGDAEILRARVRPATMAAEGVLHDLGVIPMTSSDSQGMGRVGETLRRMLQNAALMKRRFGSGGAHDDNERVLRHIAKATVNPAITHGIAEHVGSLQVGRLADCVLWRPELCGVRPELVVKAGVPAWGASGDGNATTMLAEPVRVGPQVGAMGAAPDRIALAFVAEAGMDADLPTARERAAVRGCREIGAADMVRNDRRGTIRVDPATHAVTLDGELVAAAPAAEVPLSARYLLG
jgi:urease subunit alpha